MTTDSTDSTPNQPTNARNTLIHQSLKQWQHYTDRWLSIAIGIGAISGLLLIAQASLLARIINAVLFAQATLSQVMPWLWSMLVLFLFRAGLTWAAEQAAVQAALQVKLNLRQQLYAKIQRLGPAWLTQERSGDVVNSLSDGIEALEPYYARYLPSMTLVVFIPFAILVAVLPNDWLSAVVMLLTAPLIPFFMILIGKGTEKRNQQQWQQLAWMSAHFLDVIQGLTSLKLFNASQREAKMIAHISDQYRQSTMSVLRVAFLSSFVLEFLASISIAIVAVLIGFRLFWGEMPFLAGFFVLLLAPEFYLPLRSMGTHYHARLQAIGAAERIVDILNTPEPDRADPTDQLLLTAHSTQQAIRFTSVSFSYPDGRTALQDFNLTIPAGKTLALVGPSGAGKSTILHLLLGFLQPQAGEISIGEQTLTKVALAAWHEQLAWLPQKPHLFPGTVADNIRLGQQQASQAVVEQAAQQAQAHAFITELPQGYDTLIGEAGHGLSGGQIQRIALARAFLKNAPIVILDEATAHLDRQSEALIQQALQQLSQGRTVIMIAHRLNTVRHADQIALIDHGQVVALDTHAALLQTAPLYQQLFNAFDPAL